MNDGFSVHFDDFCAWLCEKEHEVVGRPGIGYSDPLSEWLSTLAGRVCGIEGNVCGPISLDDRYWRWLLPLWARLFFTFTERYMFARPMTGREAFDVLAHIEQQYGVLPL